MSDARYPVLQMPSAHEVKTRIEAAIPGAQAEVDSADEVHFSALVRAGAFEGLSRVQQHRLGGDCGCGHRGGRQQDRNDARSHHAPGTVALGKNSCSPLIL